jgi:hypothetical protein
MADGNTGKLMLMLEAITIDYVYSGYCKAHIGAKDRRR